MFTEWWNKWKFIQLNFAMYVSFRIKLGTGIHLTRTHSNDTDNSSRYDRMVSVSNLYFHEIIDSSFPPTGWISYHFHEFRIRQYWHSSPFPADWRSPVHSNLHVWYIISLFHPMIHVNVYVFIHMKYQTVAVGLPGFYLIILTKILCS